MNQLTDAPARVKPKRWSRRLPIFVGIISLAAGAALGVWYRSPEVARWKASSERYRIESANLRARAERSEADAEGLRDLASRYQNDWRSTMRELADLQGKVRESVGNLDHPSFVTWNVPTRLTADTYLAASVPDTFTFEAELNSTAPIKLMIMELADFACWHTHACASNWVEWSSDRRPPGPGFGLSQPGRGRHWINAVFHKAEGCASYVAVITGSGYITPNLSITSNPARHPTGACR